MSPYLMEIEPMAHNSEASLTRPSRRSVVRTAAWCVPVVSVAATAPAFAASCTTEYSLRLDWGSTGSQFSKAPNGNSATASAAGPAGSTPLLVTFGSSYLRQSGNDRRAANNLSVPSDTNVGGAGVGEQALMLRHLNHGSGRNFRQELTISFARAVTELKFRISDIDSLNGTFYDRVELTGTRTGVKTGVRGTGIFETETDTGEGTGPWRSTDSNSNANTNTADRIVDVTYAGTIAANSPITLTYYSSRAGSEQYLFLGDFTFKAKNC